MQSKKTFLQRKNKNYQPEYHELYFLFLKNYHQIEKLYLLLAKI